MCCAVTRTSRAAASRSTEAMRKSCMRDCAGYTTRCGEGASPAMVSASSRTQTRYSMDM